MQASVALPSSAASVYPLDALLGWGVPGQGFLTRTNAFKKPRAERRRGDTAEVDGEAERAPKADAARSGAHPEDASFDEPELPGSAELDVLVAAPAPSTNGGSPVGEDEYKSAGGIHERLDRLEMLVDSQEGALAPGNAAHKRPATADAVQGGAVHEEVLRLAEHVRVLSADLSEVRASFHVQQKELGDSRMKQAEAEGQLSDALTSRGTLEEAAGSLTVQLTHKSAEADALRAQLAEEKDHSARLEARVAAESEVMGSMMQRIKDLESDLQKSQAEASALKQNNEKLQDTAERARVGGQEAASRSEGKQKQLDVLSEKLNLAQSDSLKKMNLLRTLTNDNQSLNHLLREARGEISDLEKGQEKLVGHMNHLRGELEHVHKLYSNMEHAALTFQESPPPTARGPATAAMPRLPPPPPSEDSEQARRTAQSNHKQGAARPATANPLHRPTADFLAWEPEAEARPRTSGATLKRAENANASNSSAAGVDAPPTPPRPGTAAVPKPMASADLCAPVAEDVPAAGAPSQSRAERGPVGAAGPPTLVARSSKPYATQRDVEMYMQNVAGTEKLLMHLSMEKSNWSLSTQRWGPPSGARSRSAGGARSSSRGWTKSTGRPALAASR